MSGDSKFFIGVIIAAVIVIGGVIGFSKSKPTPSAENIDISSAYKIGEDTLPVRIVEFGDFQCPACQGAAEPLRQAVEKNKDKVQLSFMHFPLTQHDNAIPAALAAEAAGKQGKFWEMYDLLYANQKQWENLKETEETFVSYAKSLELNVDDFKRELLSSELKQKINKDLDYAIDLGVNQTPTFYVNGQKLTGIISADDWQKYIDDAFAAKNDTGS